jgi:GNAT superfamily N-acetyltransferase
MERGDVDFALDITAKEGWGFLRADMERLLALTPGGCFIARRDGRNVGLLTTICHRKFCWIGNVAVRDGFRGKGIGRRLVLAALEHARASGLNRVGLVCREKMVGFYKPMGFSMGQRITGMAGTPVKRTAGVPDISVRPATRKLLPQIIRLDGACCGDERGPMLWSFFRDIGCFFLVHLDGGKVDGFIVGKPGTNGMEIGPWTVRSGNEDAARALFFALSSLHKGPVELYVPSSQRWALEFLQKMGLKRSHLFNEMNIGGSRPAEKGFRMLALAGLEKG